VLKEIVGGARPQGFIALRGHFSLPDTKDTDHKPLLHKGATTVDRSFLRTKAATTPPRAKRLLRLLVMATPKSAHDTMDTSKRPSNLGAQKSALNALKMYSGTHLTVLTHRASG
jgi:hypothetical protein